ncbi:MAG: hypothetical protein IPM45_14560 [Acidimicrobiales bacterium]|nr:hypothetical protein [Acidimicrobiales bacterium]
MPAPSLDCRAAADPSAPVTWVLAAGVPLRVRSTRGAWAEVETEQGWTAWVDGRLLEEVR